MDFPLFGLVSLLVLFAAVFFMFRGQIRLAILAPIAIVMGLWASQDPSWPVWTTVAIALGVALALFGIPPIRRTLVSSPVMKTLASVLPTISETEKVALEAGTVWWDAELFSGQPDFRRVLDYRPQDLNDKERAFLEGPTEELCRMLDDWQGQSEGDLPPEVWEFMKAQRFWGMIIPEEHGGLGFSAIAHSAIVTKLASRSVGAAVTVMVPNSLGPAELLLHYGTEDQKKHYLPRLARGEEIPCFALTEPNAGSDAASIESSGVVCRGTWEGKEVLGMRLNWEKRYITLSPIATVLGLAFKLYDPDKLLGEQEDLGITCALIPPDLPGVEIGKRHDPLGIPFQNGPNIGRDVFVPLDFVIGGQERVGQGWMMLMQCLAAGRAISLPSLSCGAAQLTSRVVGAYGNIREQFNVRIGLFEGIEECIGRIAGKTYMMNAARTLTASSVDAGEKPAVVSAIGKAYMTQMMREVVNDGMDVQAGAGICRGPRNVLASPYASVPIGITVEGANILTRTLIVYGQGALRCHPWVRAQVEAVEENDLVGFDHAFFSHVGFTVTNVARSFVLGLTCSALAPSPVGGVAGGYFRQLSRASAGFATLSDASMAVLGGSLKRREMLSGRLADALGWMYLTTCTLKEFVDRGQPKEEEPFLHWSCQYGIFQVQQAMLGVLDNFPSKFVAFGLRQLLFPPGSRVKAPTDRLTSKVSQALLGNEELRQRLTQDIYIPEHAELGLGTLERALECIRDVEPVIARVKKAVKEKKLPRARGRELYDKALEAKVITVEERKQLDKAADAANEAVQVDAFAPKEEPALN